MIVGHSTFSRSDVKKLFAEFLGTFGLVFAGTENQPMPVQLTNIVGTTFGERAYNKEMASALFTAALPLVVYFFSGRLFVRGVLSGAVKG